MKGEQGLGYPPLYNKNARPAAIAHPRLQADLLLPNARTTSTSLSHADPFCDNRSSVTSWSHPLATNTNSNYQWPHEENHPLDSSNESRLDPWRSKSEDEVEPPYEAFECVINDTIDEDDNEEDEDEDDEDEDEEYSLELDEDESQDSSTVDVDDETYGGDETVSTEQLSRWSSLNTRDDRSWYPNSTTASSYEPSYATSYATPSYAPSYVDSLPGNFGNSCIGLHASGCMDMTLGRYYYRIDRRDDNPGDGDNARRERTLEDIHFPETRSAPSHQLSIGVNSAKSDHSGDDMDKNGKSKDDDNGKGGDDVDDPEIFPPPSRQATLSFGMDGAKSDRSSDDYDKDSNNKKDDDDGKVKDSDSDSNNNNDNKDKDDDTSQAVHAPKIRFPPSRLPTPLVVINNDTRNESAWNRCPARKPMSLRGNQNKNKNTTSTFPIARPDFPVTNGGLFSSCGALFSWSAE